MLIAVSCLSPVNTHTLMLAFLRAEMVSGTPSCNLSSIAVAPNNVMSFSIASATSSTYTMSNSYHYDYLLLSVFNS
jgi:hypothetical protein